MKKSMLVLICVLLCMFALSGGVLAEEYAPWNGQVNTAWYNTTDTTFEIDTAAELAGLAVIVNGTAEGIEKDNFKGKTINLTADVDLGGVQNEDGTWDPEKSMQWIPIGGDDDYNGDSSRSFNGVFNGNGHKIRNLFYYDVESNSKWHIGLFGYISNARIRDTHVESGHIELKQKISSGGHHAGLVGKMAGGSGVINCSNGADVIGARYVGGITGRCDNIAAIINNCFNSGDITGACNVGGIIGYTWCPIMNCYNTGDVHGTYDGNGNRGNWTAGGIFGSHYLTYPGASMVNCYNIGNVTSVKGNEKGGIGGEGSADMSGGSRFIIYEDMFYLKTDSINSNITSFGYLTEDRAGTAAKDVDGMKSEDTLAALGNSFVADKNGINGGYPVLSWQPDGVYPQDEIAGLDISSEGITLTDGGFSFAMNKAVEYTSFFYSGSYKSFAVSCTMDGAAVELKDLTLASTETDENGIATLNFTYSNIFPAEREITLNVRFVYSDKVFSETYTTPEGTTWADYSAVSYDGGTGTYNDPYQIATAEQLGYLAYMVNNGTSYENSYFVLTENIDLKAKDGKELLWQPIGKPISVIDNYRVFKGSFNGNGKIISNMTADHDGTAGLFGTVGSMMQSGNPRIINVTLSNVDVTGTSSAALIGSAAGGTIISNCHVISGKVNGGNAGGLVGSYSATNMAGYPNSFKPINGCSVDVDVYATGNAGGLIGSVLGSNTSGSYLTVSDCSSAGDVVLTNADAADVGAGGLIGSVALFHTINVENCYVAGNVKTSDGQNYGYRIGGLVGTSYFGKTTQTVPNLNLRNNVVLSSEISGFSTEENGGRVISIGAIEEDAFSVNFSNNYVLADMKVNGTAFTGANADDRHGISKTKAELETQSIWESLGFDIGENAMWKWDETLKRPVLNGLTASYPIFITTQPNNYNNTAYSNRDASFIVVAGAGAGTLSYQWQRSEDGENWIDLPNADSASVEIGAKLAWDGNMIRCQVTDSLGTVKYSDVVTYLSCDAAFDAQVGANETYARYALNDRRNAGDAFYLYSYKEDLSELTFEINYSAAQYHLALTDWLAQGKNPREFVNYAPTGAVEMDLISTLLSAQNGENGSFSTDAYAHVLTVLGMDVYFSGKDVWGNESADTALGRNGAVDYLFSLLYDDEASGGQYYYQNAINTQNNFRNNGLFVIMMARLADDPVYGARAKDAMYDILAWMEYNEGDTSVKSTDGLNRYTEGCALYVSALLAAADVTGNADRQEKYTAKAEEFAEIITTSRDTNGMYKNITSYHRYSSSGSALNTAKACLGFSDYANGRSVWATFNYDADDNACLVTDISNINIPETVLNDIVLPTKGAVHGADFVWKSSHPDLLSAEGKVNRPAEDTPVRLTLTATYGEATQIQEYIVTVVANRVAGGDEAYADAENLKILPEYLEDITLPASGENGSAITWASSNTDVITNDGKLTRPAATSESDHAMVTLTATVTNGDATETREFPVKVWAAVDTTTAEGMVKETYYQYRVIYMNKTVLKTYWDTWACYAVLGDQMYDFDYVYDTNGNSGSQPGANIMGVVALGENPYDYNGVDMTRTLVENGTGGAYAIPVFNTMAVEHAGIKGAELQFAYCAGQLKNLGMGPDIGGWAAIPLSRHLDESESYMGAVDYFSTETSKALLSGTSGWNLISVNCIMMGLNALYDAGVEVAGIEGFDVTENDPWVDYEMVEDIYTMLSSDFEAAGQGYGAQSVIGMCDLYNVLFTDRQCVWLELCLDKEKVQKQIAKAEDIIENEGDYTAESVADVKAALEVVKGISEERLNARTADYGREYYELYDAVRFVVSASAPVVDETALNEAKEAAVAELEAAFAEYDSNDYLASNWDILVAAKNNGLMMINAAKDEAAVASAKADAIAAMAAVPVSSDAKQIEVTFRLIGATRSTQPVDFSINPGEYYGSEYQNWIKTTTYRFDEGATVYDVLIKALNENGMTQTGGNNNYVASITAPAVLGGEKLSEFDNGTNSGWMYTINGLHPGLGVKQYVLEDGDALVVHYVNDFKYEDESTYPDSPYLNKWLEVPDLAPGETPVDPEEPVELPFTDVADDFWGMDAIEFVYAKGIMNGTSNTTFEPNKTLSRAMYITMIYRLEGAPAVVGSHEYSDVLADKWYTNAVIWGTANGIITGYENGTFRPDGDVSREEMATMMYRYAAYKGIDVSATAGFEQFNDGATVSDWAKTYMGWAVAEGLMKGDTDGNLKPTGQATRAEAATVIMRFADIVK